jgi:MOSC domain-containing protein YiiM
VAEVLHLFQAVEHGQPMRESDEVAAVENKGFRDCLHGRPDSKRQVLLMDAETLEGFGIAPGRVKENITTRGIELGGLSAGQHLRVGEALLEVTTPCTPCRHMEEIRTGLQKDLRGRRGVLCRVLKSGRIRRGDRIDIVTTEPSGLARVDQTISTGVKGAIG